MNLEFISLIKNKRDQKTFTLKAKSMPGKLAKFFGFKEREVSYYGNGKEWYRLPSGNMVKDAESNDIRQMLEYARRQGKIDSTYNF